MAYSDNRWDLVTAGRVYPKAKPVLVLTDVNEPFASPIVADASVLREYNPKAAHKPGDSPLVKPLAYKARNESNGSGRS